jgi:glycine dehydrogenase subunit 1
MYDGATAAAEAMMMAMASTKKKTRVLLSEGLLPQVIKVVKTYAKFNGVELGFIPCQDGVTSYGAMLTELAAGDVAGVLVPGINKYGIIEDFTGFADAVHAQKGLFMVYSDPSSLAVIKTPGEWGADIVCGDSQTMGIPLCYGGPYVGFLACTKDHVRKLPGRIVGATKDVDGKRAYVLTLQAREQHIRREKATSNICTAQGIMCLYVASYLALMGKKGLREVNEQSYGAAHELHKRLLALPCFSEAYPGKPFLNEFTLKCSLDISALQDNAYIDGFIAGVKAEAKEDEIIFAATEQRSPEEVEALVESIAAFCAEQGL